MVEQYAVVIKGIRPLLMHKYTVESESDSKKMKTRYDPKEDAENALYKDDEGRICTPSIHIESALSKAATSFKQPGKGRKTYRDLIKSGIQIEPLNIPHKYPEWKIDIQRAVIGRSAVPRARPRFDKWELEFIINLVDPTIVPATLQEILNDAGRYIGIGDYRPRYGLFEVTKFERVQ
jgi:hypothetical protein